jgi:hypothetical protein
MSLRRVITNFNILTSLVVSLIGINVPPALSSVSTLEATSTNSPVLLIVNSSATNKFGSYLGEILRAEGLNAFDQVEFNSLTASQLAQYDVAILAQTSLTSAQATTLTNYVSAGGALLDMRPDPQIARLFGLSLNVGALSDGYLQIKNDAVFNGVTIGYGLISDTLQIHGMAAEYDIAADTVTLAQLYQ